jgi:hypothetical protein
MKTNKRAVYAATVLALAITVAGCKVEFGDWTEPEPALKIAVTGISSEYNGKLGFILIFNELDDEYEVAQCSGTIERRSVGGSLNANSLYGDWSAWTTKGAYYVKLEIYGNYDEEFRMGPIEAVYASEEKISIQSETPVKFSTLELASGE